MAAKPDQGQPGTNVSGEFRPQGKGPHDDVEVRVGYGLVHVPHLGAFLCNVHIREFRLTEVEDGWRGMFKGDRAGKPVVAYVFQTTYKDALVLAITSMDLGQLSWTHDQYPPKRFSSPGPRLLF